MLTIIALAAFLGLACGLRKPILGPDPYPGVDPTDPPIRRKFSDPMPGIKAAVLGIIGGIAAGVIVHYLLPSEGLTIISIAAFAGATILIETVGRFGRQRA